MKRYFFLSINWKVRENFNQVVHYILILILSFLWVAPAVAQTPDYSIFKRPGSQDQPTPVHIGMAVLDIDDIDGATQTITANVVLNIRWKDPRLASPGRTDRTFGLNEVWNPRIQFVNQRKVWKTFPEVVQVEEDGTVIYRQRYWGQFSYPFNLRDFPLDRDRFGLILAAAGFSPQEIQFVTNHEYTDLSPDYTQADWIIDSWSVEAKNYQSSPRTPEVPGYVFWIDASRRVGFYVIKILIPLTMIIFMSYMIFWIDNENFGQKISVAVTAMLTLIAYRFNKANKTQLAQTIDYWTRGLFPLALVLIILFSFVV